MNLLFQIEKYLGDQNGPSKNNKHWMILEINVIYYEINETDEIEPHLKTVESFSVFGVANVYVLETILDFPDKEEDSEGEDHINENEAKEEEKVVV